MKPKVLVCVLCGYERGDWLNPLLTLNLMVMLRDARFDVAYQPVCQFRPFEYARNQTINLARQMGADWLISFDNDNFVDGNPLDIIAEAGEEKHIIGLTYGVGLAPACFHFPLGNHGAEDGAFREENTVAGGVLMVRNTVWKAIPRGPWFRWHSGTDELLAPDPDGMPEDAHFCRLAQEHGFKVWTHRSLIAGHLKTQDVSAVVATLDEITGGAWSKGSV